jgi:hypothetical protein
LQSSFANIKKQPYEKRVELKEERTIAELAAIYFSTPENELERSLINHDDIPDDQEKEELDNYFDNAPKVEDLFHKKYEELERKGNEELPPPELKALLEGLRYEFLDK